ncbi:MAG: SEC59/DGK1/VTE5 family protein [Bacteriovoracaceae bacterium]|nr:SEC59/DGK1/VTE5 family protein [Bacteriovoracaceae bacterium]
MEKKDEDTPLNIKPQGEDTDKLSESAPTATRKSLQLPRRLFHCGMGISLGLVYQFLLTHSRAIYILGFCACVVYILEQIRINYPELAGKVKIINKYLFRAEEQLKESAGVPYVMGILLTLISFPKVVALVAIYTLAVADPMSAIIGIKYGKTKVVPHKSLEGSLAFFISTFIITFLVFFWWTSFLQIMIGPVFLLSFLVALIASLFEMIPLRLDDNLTIPLFTAGLTLLLCSMLVIPV